MEIDFEELYARYVDDRSGLGIYRNGLAEIGEPDLASRLAADLDEIQSEYGSLDMYANPDEEGIIMEIYSISEADALYKELKLRGSIEE